MQQTCEIEIPLDIINEATTLRNQSSDICDRIKILEMERELLNQKLWILLFKKMPYISRMICRISDDNKSIRCGTNMQEVFGEQDG
jgi:hypothetical protein